MSRVRSFETEAGLVEAFCALLPGQDHRAVWTAYHETAGWDLLLVGRSGIQIGLEAKLLLNAKVLEQSLPGRWADERGPDYRAVLVPRDGLQNHLSTIAYHLGIVVLTVSPKERYSYSRFDPDLPDEAWDYSTRRWPNWCPSVRCMLPEYVPDVTGGHASPVQLSPWKIKAIKLLILLERHGAVTRMDMKLLEISPSRWTDRYAGLLSPNPLVGGYVRNTRTPDLRSQHPVNWAQIEADFETWGKNHPATQLALLGAVA